MTLSDLYTATATDPAAVVRARQVIFTTRVLWAKVSVVGVLVILRDQAGNPFGWFGEASQPVGGPLETGFGPLGSRQAWLAAHGVTA